MKWLYFVTSETNIFEQDAMQGVKKQVLKCHSKVARCCIGPELGKDYNGLQKTLQGVVDCAYSGNAGHARKTLKLNPDL